MALVKCKECGKEISSKAEACPSCGAKRSSEQYGCGTLVVASLFALIVWGMVSNSWREHDSDASATPAAPAKPAITIDKSEQMQADRKKLIEKMIAQGVIQKVSVTAGGVPEMFVRPSFYGLDFDTKNSFASVVFAFHFNGTEKFPSIRLRDSRTNKEIGTYGYPTFKLELE